MITKRIIPCLDVRDGRVVKGVNFQGLRDVSSPLELAKYYSDNGADELVFYDITASAEGRRIFTDILRETARNVFIPLTVGGGIASLEDFERVLDCGADKVSVNTGAIANPDLIPQAAERYGSQCVVLSVDVKRVGGVGGHRLPDVKSGGQFHVFARGGREDTGMEAIGWIRRCVEAGSPGNPLCGAGEVVVNSIDTDGMRGGFDLEMLKAVTDVVSVPVIASGGAGSVDDFITLFRTLPGVDAGLAASVFHPRAAGADGEIPIRDLKARMAAEGIPVRL
ncbi:MAG: imidazole glycerol phosphate synthase subunit HisF [Fretibacterium sp.]|nr:imidazole glycerol phosphate synthase subunit HisF [Fretibacterium sp.]